MMKKARYTVEISYDDHEDEGLPLHIPSPSVYEIWKPLSKSIDYVNSIKVNQIA